jgi:hypothetical protein
MKDSNLDIIDLSVRGRKKSFTLMRVPSIATPSAKSAQIADSLTSFISS